MAQLGPPAIIEPITGPPARGGLLRSVTVEQPLETAKADAAPDPSTGMAPVQLPPDAEAEARRWEMGVEYRPLGGCAGVGVWAPCSGEMKLVDAAGPLVNGVPFTVYAGYKCSTWGLEEAERIAQAEARMNLRGGSAIEAELWKGTIAQAEGWDTPYLASPATQLLTSGSETSPLPFALAALQEAFRECYGSDYAGTVHAPTTTVSLWQKEHMVGPEIREVDGEQVEVLVDLYGNVVVAGGGYDGSSPTGDIDPTGRTSYAYITGPVKVLLGPVYFDPDHLVQAVARDVNDVIWIAERSAIALFDPCCVFGINVDNCSTCCADPDVDSE